MEQVKILVNKGFLNSNLILSLLVSIFQSGKTLPENRLKLYKELFDKVSSQREKLKSKLIKDFDINKIDKIMNDSTFKELAILCYPNNKGVKRGEIVSHLCTVHSKKFSSEDEREDVIGSLLDFCAERTELFTISPDEEDSFKFYHRSFYEYFYAEYICSSMHRVEDIYAELDKFDVDSEIFELVISRLKVDYSKIYDSLVEFIFDEMEKELLLEVPPFIAINIATIFMQIVDEPTFVNRYAKILFENKGVIIKRTEDFIHITRQNHHLLSKPTHKNIKNFGEFTTAPIIVEVLQKEVFKDSFIEAYGASALSELINSLHKRSNSGAFIDTKRLLLKLMHTDKTSKDYWHCINEMDYNLFVVFFTSSFYLKVYIQEYGFSYAAKEILSSPELFKAEEMLGDTAEILELFAQFDDGMFKFDLR